MNETAEIPTGPLLIMLHRPERTIDLGPYRRQWVLYDHDETKVIGSAANEDDFVALMFELTERGVPYLVGGYVPDSFELRMGSFDV